MLAVTFRRWYGWYAPPYLSGGATQCGHCAALGVSCRPGCGPPPRPARALADAVAMVGEHRTVPVIGLFVYSGLVFHDVLVDHLVEQDIFAELHSAGGESNTAHHVRVCPVQQ